MLRNVFYRVALAAAVLLILASRPAILGAQQAPADVPAVTIRANTRLVVVDVVVTDKKGQPVTGLKAEDFTVEENGKKQKVSVFVPPGAAQPAAQPLPPGILSNRPEFLRPPGVPTVLLLDVANSPFKDQAYGRLQMLKYVQTQEESGTPMAVMTLTDRLHVLQEFTSDPKTLATAIRNLRPQQQPFQPGATPVSSSTAAGLGTIGSGTAAAISMAQAQIADFQNGVAGFNLLRRTEITIAAMRDLSRVLAGFPGRKNVVWLTAEFPFDLIPEDRNMSNAELAADLPNIRKKSLSTISAGTLASEARQMHGDEIKQAESQLASSDIAIYPVDMRGIMSSGIDVANTGTMEEVAAETGGKAYTNQNEVKFGIALAVSDEKASYTLGYYPDNKKWDGKYRSVKVNVTQGDTQVRYRKGYFAIEPGQIKNYNYEQDVAAALQVNAPATQVSFMAQAKPTAPGKIRVIFLVDALTLTAEDAGGGKKMNVSLYASVYNAAGKNMGTRSMKVDRTFDAATYQQILDKGMMVPIDIEISAGSKELRLAVLDNKTGFIGTVSGPLGE